MLGIGSRAQGCGQPAVLNGSIFRVPQKVGLVSHHAGPMVFLSLNWSEGWGLCLTCSVCDSLLCPSPILSLWEDYTEKNPEVKFFCSFSESQS